MNYTNSDPIEGSMRIDVTTGESLSRSERTNEKELISFANIEVEAGKVVVGENWFGTGLILMVISSLRD